MRALTTTFVSLATAVGIAAGGLATAGTAMAAPTSIPQQAASAEAVAPLAVNNLGLSIAEAKRIQQYGDDRWGYTGPIDGLLGTESWKALQRWLKASWEYNDSIDGIVGPNTVKALQRYLKDRFEYTGAIDGIAGSGTKAAFKRMANACPDC
ncbi:peptidoglycan-binding domain-containing protein [Streptomyces sp. enrichment culture]|uniref:peptidoglycan-binding domain-containing protein n=1 Tax=Streptomyces sp. enrichment culture TaxID=1795815 RepID=UPI003F57F8A3